jgi:hypothetical protein
MKTPEVAKLIGRNYWSLINAIRSGRIPLPQKDSSGHYVWQTEDVERARNALSKPRPQAQPS